MDDTFDEDESLLVSPPTRQSFGGFLDEHAADNSSPSCHLGNASSDDDVIFHRGVGNDDPSNQSFSESSDSFDAQTPVKPKFSYASAMDALDDLVPSAIKARRRATCFRRSKSSSEGEREASAENEIDNSCVNSPAAKPDNSFLLTESQDVYFSSQLDGDTGKDPATEGQNDKSIQTYDYARPPEAISLNIYVRNRTPDASSVFPYPCIRRHNMSDDEDLELKYGHPLKASFNVKVDIEGTPTNPGNIDSCTSRERRVELLDMSTEVGCDKDGACLDAGGIINSINFDTEDDDPACLGEWSTHKDSLSEDCVAGYCDSADALNQLRTIAVEKAVSSPLDGDKDVGRNMSKHATDTMADVMNFESVRDNQNRYSFNVDDFTSCVERRFSQPMATSVLTAHVKSCQSTEQECNISLRARPENTTEDLHNKSPSQDMDDHISRNIVCDAQSHLLQSSHALRKDFTYLDLPLTSVGVGETPSSFSCSETLSPIAKCFSPRIVCDDTMDYKLPFFEKLPNPTAVLGMNESSRSDLPPIMSDTSRHVVDEGNAILNRGHPTEADLKEQSDEPDGLLDSCSPTNFDVLPHHCEPIESSVSRRVRRSFTVDDNYDQDVMMPRLALSPSGDQPNGENTRAGNNQQSLCDLTSFRDAFSSTSNALLQRMQGSEETRKRDVKRRCYSLELKERIMLPGKDLSASTPVVTESLPAGLLRTSIPSKPNTKIELLHPYKPFGAKHIPSTTIKTERSRNSAGVNVPKFTSKTSVRKMLLPGEDPYKPFKALPLPSTHGIRQRNSSIGTNRKPSNALRPHSEQNKSSVKPSGLQGKPPTRILSGQDASMAKQISQRNRMVKEDAKHRRQSVFKARPLPSSALSSDLIGEIIITEVSDKENDRSSRTSSQKRQSFSKPFTPHSTRRAQERAAFEIERAEREKEITQERRKKMTDLIDQTKVEIEELKACIR